MTAVLDVRHTVAVSLTWHQPAEVSVLHAACALCLHSEDRRRDGYSEEQAEPAERFSGTKDV